MLLHLLSIPLSTLMSPTSILKVLLTGKRISFIAQKIELLEGKKRWGAGSLGRSWKDQERCITISDLWSECNLMIQFDGLEF